MREEGRLTDDGHRFNRRGARHRAAAISAPNPSQVRRIHDFRPAGHRGDRHARSERLGHDDQIRHDVVVLDREQTAGATHAALHFIGNHDDAMLGAEFTDAPEESGRYRDEPRFALNRLDNHRGDGRRIHLRIHLPSGLEVCDTRTEAADGRSPARTDRSRS